MFSRELSHSGHTRRFIVNALHAEGWEVRVELDDRVERQTRYTDWHRVERALGAMEREVAALESRGWHRRDGRARSAAYSTNR